MTGFIMTKVTRREPVYDKVLSLALIVLSGDGARSARTNQP
jgi:hypothetical protein